jgi:cell division protein ZapE
LICLDELQINNVADAMIIKRLFEALIKMNVTLTITSNIEPKQLYKDGLQRECFLPFIDLIYQHLDVIDLDNKIDYRMSKIKDESVTYFYPLGQDAEDFINKQISVLTDNMGMDESIIDVYGRKLHLSNTCKNIALVTFQELCGRDLGSADYIAIAKAFDIIILTNIPKLLHEEKNEAIRFISLIDELYLHKVILICSAAVPVDQIYEFQDSSVPFARTVSRLVEMQSTSYRALGNRNKN